MAACRMSAWYPTLARHALKAAVILLPDEFLEYLRSDGMALPLPAVDAPLHGHDPRRASSRRRRASSSFSSSSSSSCSSSSSSSSSSAVPAKVYSFPELDAAIEAAVAELGGSVFPRLEWTAPADAVWITETRSLKCENAGQVYRLLKASDLVQYDITTARRAAAAPLLHLVLRRWYALSGANEWRGFVTDGALVAVSQRAVGTMFDRSPGDDDRVRALLVDFVADVLRPSVPLASYAFDVYIDRKDRVWLLDLAPAHGTTATLLYTPEEVWGGDGAACCQHAASGAAAAGGSGGTTTSTVPPPTAASMTPTPVRVVTAATMTYAPHAAHGFPDDALNWAATTGKGLDDLLAHLAADSHRR